MNKKDQEKWVTDFMLKVVSCLWFAITYALIYIGAITDQFILLFIALISMAIFWDFELLKDEARK